MIMKKPIKKIIAVLVFMWLVWLLGRFWIPHTVDTDWVIATPTTWVTVEITSWAIEAIVDQVYYMLEASTRGWADALVARPVEETWAVVEEAPVVEEYFILEDVEVVEEVSTANYYSNVEAKSVWYLQDNVSRTVFRNLTGVNFMNSLNATMVKIPEGATEAYLTITLDKEGAGMQNAMHTWNVTVGYESCKVDEVLDRDNFPITKTIDLANVNCKNRGVKNFLPSLKDWVRVAIYHAQLDGTSYDWVISSN